MSGIYKIVSEFRQRRTSLLTANEKGNVIARLVPNKVREMTKQSANISDPSEMYG